MVSEKKDGKRPYEPPKIYELEVDLNQAMGMTQCARGNQATGSCARGNNPGGAQLQCRAGRAPGGTCARGGRPSG